MTHPAPTASTDVAIIGAGSAGMAAYRAALRHTERVVLIESHVYGTTCARVGCMPSKLLIAAAEAAHSARQAHRFGVNVPPIDIDGRAVMARVRSERDRFVGFVVDTVEQWPVADRWLGHARFVDTHTLVVDGLAGPRRLQAERIVIATGSRPAVPPAWRAALGERLIVNDDVFDWTDLPGSVAVVGTGVVGLELAQALHRLGVRVRLFGRGSRIGPLTHPALQALAREVFAAELPLTLNVRDLKPRREGDAVVLRTELADGTVQEERFDFLLAATGRRPNVDRLGLEHTALPLDPQGVPVFDRRTGQVGDSAVFMAGDAADDRALLHEAADEGRIAGDNAGRWPAVRLRPRRAPLAVVFSEPQMALVGATHAELVASGTAFETGEVSFADQGRSRVMARNHGALQVYAQRGSGRLLGAEMLGPAAEHLGHLLAWSVQRGDTVQQMLDSPFYHPVVEEGLRTALRDAQRALQLPAPAPEHCLECNA
ncbi:Dihydrolipoamide dehydrogenase [Rubrivivax sp. A210]|uniref:dihydrolipoyl dehydrogenase n=1 Tax=Rubrivivax sp. A210 TaxID=2772301 RepID=UPI001919D5AD|nr:dihydrolipoyl dehydrogenase [Rubrivivax sp. A210]CAD5371061.1 Dihydrolipoamide dehydrogenase [Rubrivivax sp. A210]